MVPSRRHVLQVIAGAATLPAGARMAAAETYPTRPVHLIVGFAPGSGNDTSARLVAQWLSERLGQQVVVENRTGASGNLAIEAVARAHPDGYTLLSIGPASAINASLYGSLGFRFIHDIAPVAGVMRVPNVMVVNPSLPAKTVPEFIAYAKANPGKVNMATAGSGSTLRMFGELFQMMAGIKLVAVAYRGGAPALLDLLGGEVQVMIGPLPEALGYIRAGKLHALAVTTAARSPELPDTPTIGEFLPGYETSTWYGVGAPRNTPPDIVERLNGEITAALADPQVQARIAGLGGTPLPLTAAAFGKFMADETERWGKVIQAAGIKPD